MIISEGLGATHYVNQGSEQISTRRFVRLTEQPYTTTTDPCFANHAAISRAARAFGRARVESPRSIAHKVQHRKLLNQWAHRHCRNSVAKTATLCLRMRIGRWTCFRHCPM
jgi:hypothetical protein